MLQNTTIIFLLTRPNHAGVPALKLVRQNGKNITVKAMVDIHPGDVIEMPDGQETFTFANTVKAGQNTTFVTHKKQNFVKDHVLNRTRNEKLLTEVNQDIISRKVKEKINGKLKLFVGETAKLSLYYKNIVVEAEGAVVEAAMNQPMDSARIEKQMRKTGNTEFEFDKLDIEVCGNIFMPMQNLNELRRTALEQLEERILFSYRRTEPENISYKTYEKVRNEETILSVYVEEEEQFEEVLLSNAVKRIYLDVNARVQVDKAISKAKEYGKEIFLGMPHIFRKNARDVFEKQYGSIVEAQWDGMLVRNYEEFEFLKRHGYTGKIVTDYNVYQFNQYAKAFWNKEGVGSSDLPVR